MRPDVPDGEVAAPLEIDRTGVDRCFGCGEANEDGLHLRFSRFSDGTIETRHRAASHHCGLDTVVHGGIQATILDEVMGVAAQFGLEAGASDMACITAEMHLRYRRPVTMASDVIARAKIDHVDDRGIHVSGAIVDAEHRTLTEAVSRWRQLRTD